MNKIAIILADGFEDIEAITPYDQLKRAGIEVDLITINTSLTAISSHGLKMVANKFIGDTNFKDYVGIVIPGGTIGVNNLKQCNKLVDTLIEYNKQNKLIGAICAAPTILIELGIIDKQKYTCYPGMQKESSNYSDDPVVVSNNLITSTFCGTSSYFGIAIIDYILGSEMANKISNQTLYKGKTNVK